jgi:Amidohydrolase
LNSPGQELFKDPYFYIHMVGMPFNLMVGIMTLIGGGIMEKYPRIKFVFLEIGAAWLPYWMWRMDDHYSRAMHHPTGVPKKPSDYVRSDSCFVSCEPDETGLANTAEVLGSDRIVFASDYPHGDCDFPHSVTNFAAVPISPMKSKRRFSGKILCGSMDLADARRVRQFEPTGGDWTGKISNCIENRVERWSVFVDKNRGFLAQEELDGSGEKAETGADALCLDVFFLFGAACKRGSGGHRLLHDQSTNRATVDCPRSRLFPEV